MNCVNSFKYLGIYIDNNFKFQKHIDNLKTKLSRLCGMSFRLKNYLDFKSAIKTYYSCVYSVISYCIVTWGGTMMCTQRTIKLQKLQLRIVNNLFAKFRRSSSDVFREFSILKLPDIYRLRVCLYMYRILYLNEVPCLERLLNLEYPQHEHNTRSANELVLPFPRIEAVRMNYKYQFNHVWNNLPANLKHEPTLKIFKKSLIKYFLQSY